ncbi:MAG: hypothetical protein JNM28_11355 [Armatimonadetes bacterium]|nr:hypothetical protein [Armatimonadota bacterium]
MDSAPKTIAHPVFGRCLCLSNGDAEVLATLDFGPRIISYRLQEGENVLGEFPNRHIETGIGTFRIWGGHRLWVAPENWPVTYAADDGPVELVLEGRNASLRSPVEPLSGLQKTVKVSLSERGSRVDIDHGVRNCGAEPVHLAPWALTIMRPGGVVVIPNEPFAPHAPDRLLPVRTMALWSYTQLNDPRFSWGSDSLRIAVDEIHASPQKVGILNRTGVCRYELPDVAFVKKHGFEPEASYPDFGVNSEIYSEGSFVEIETLGPLSTVVPGETAWHHESWMLEKP